MIDKRVYLTACIYLENHMAKHHEILYVCCLWPWLGLPMAGLWYIIYFRFCGWRRFFTEWAPWCVMCRGYPFAWVARGWHKHNNLNYQILLDDYQQVTGRGLCCGGVICSLRLPCLSLMNDQVREWRVRSDHRCSTALHCALAKAQLPLLQKTDRYLLSDLA